MLFLYVIFKTSHSKPENTRGPMVAWPLCIFCPSPIFCLFGRGQARLLKPAIIHTHAHLPVWQCVCQTPPRGLLLSSSRQRSQGGDVERPVYCGGLLIMIQGLGYYFHTPSFIYLWDHLKYYPFPICILRLLTQHKAKHLPILRGERNSAFSFREQDGFG